MALISSTSDKWHSTNIFDENFGMGFDFNNLKRQFREWIDKQCTSETLISKNDSRAAVTTSEDKFQVSIDVHQFKSDEITIKVTGSNTITIEGIHEEQHKDCGFISRHFIRTLTLPYGYDINNVVSTLSSDGVLRIIAPRNGETLEYHRVPIQQRSMSLQNNKQTLYNEENFENRRHRDSEISVVQNSAASNTIHNTAQTSKEFEEVHNYIQQFLRSIDSKYKTVPILPVGPYAETQDRVQQTKQGTNSINATKIQQTEEKLTSENYKKQGYHTVPIQQTNESFTTSIDKESKTQSESNQTHRLHHSETCSKKVEKKLQNREFSIDKHEKYIQEEVLQGYRTVPIQQTGKPSESSNKKISSDLELVQTENWEKDLSKTNKTANTSQEYRTISIEQTGMEAKQNRTQQQKNEIEAKNIHTVEDTKTWENEKQNYRTVPIQQTDITSQVKKEETQQQRMAKTNSIESQTNIENKTNFERAENWEYEITKKQQTKDTSQGYRTIPVEQTGFPVKQTLHEQNKTQKTETQMQDNLEYKTIPIEKTEVYKQQVFKNNSIDLQNNVKNTENWERDINKKQQNKNTSEEYKTITIEQTGATFKQDSDNMHLVEEIKTRKNEKQIQDNLDYKSIPIEKTGIIAQEIKDEVYIKKVSKNNSVDSQYDVRNIKEFDNTENWECNTNKTKNVAITLQDYKTIPVKQEQIHKTKNTEVVEETEILTNERQVHDKHGYHAAPVKQSSISLHDETHNQKIFKNSSIDSQYNVNTTENASQEYKAIPMGQTGISSKVKCEQEFMSYTSDNVKSSDGNIKQNFRNSSELAQSDNHSKSSVSTDSLRQSTTSDKRSEYGTDHTKSSTKTFNDNVSSIQSGNSLNSAQKNELELSTTQNQQNNVAFQENEFSKEDFVRDGYRQTGFTKKNAKAEFIAQPQGFKISNEQSFYSEQTKTKEWNSNNDQAQNPTYQVQFSVDSNASEQFHRRPSTSSEICIEEITEENEKKVRSGAVSSGFKKHEASQFVSNSERTTHVQQN